MKITTLVTILILLPLSGIYRLDGDSIRQNPYLQCLGWQQMFSLNNYNYLGIMARFRISANVAFAPTLKSVKAQNNILFLVTLL